VPSRRVCTSRSIDVLTAQEDGAAHLDDDLLPCAEKSSFFAHSGFADLAFKADDRAAELNADHTRKSRRPFEQL
jgi:hypothetical protein